MCIAELFAPKNTVLPGAAIDARSAGIALRDTGLATGATDGMPINALSLESEKSKYYGS